MDYLRTMARNITESAVDKYRYLFAIPCVKIRGIIEIITSRAIVAAIRLCSAFFQMNNIKPA
ncbi:MAG: hypothetical protein ACUZ8A_04025, partial [Candidatus Bathyanammoxibius sp.]